MPFDMNSAQIASSPLAGATIKELDESFSSLDGGNLTLTFKNADFIGDSDGLESSDELR